MLPVLALAILPVVLYAALPRVQAQTVFNNSRSTETFSGRMLIGGCLLIPFTLLALASSGTWVRAAGYAFTAAGAVYAAYWLKGKLGAAVAALVVISTLIVPVGELRYDIVSLLAAIGGGVLLTAFLKNRQLLFLSLLAAVDCVVVSFDLTGRAVQGAFQDSFPLAASPPVFSGVALGGFFVGGIDLACAIIVASLVRDQQPVVRRRLIVLYALSSIATASLAFLFNQPLPATIPPLLVALVGRRQASQTA